MPQKRKFDRTGGWVFLIILFGFTALGALIGWYQMATGNAPISEGGKVKTGWEGFWYWFWFGAIGGLVIGSIIGRALAAVLNPPDPPA